MDHLFDMQPERPGYRLHRLEVFNWGTFDSTQGEIYRFEPEGRTSLLVGHNGSGKSTLVDALLTLIVDGKTRNYNVAAGAKKTERTAKSYIKGAFKRTQDETQSSVEKFLRPQGKHLTAILAVFRDEQLGKTFTLTQVLYLRGDGTDDKVYALADEEHELKQDLEGLHKSDQVREHLKQRGYQTTKIYVEYQGWIARRTRMRAKAVDIFNQTVSVKDIETLNTFIRQHMLEAHDWPGKVQRLLTHFHDLSVTHQELVRARRAEEVLVPIEQTGLQYRQQAAEMDELERRLAASAVYFPVQIARLLEPVIAEQERRVVSMTGRIQRMDDDLKVKREDIRQLLDAIDRAGGDRLRQIPGLIQLEETHLKHKQERRGKFQTDLQTCGLTQTVETPEEFDQVREQLEQTVRSAEERIRNLRDSHESAIGSKAAVESQLREERNELEILQQRRTNLPARCSTLRSRICADLNLDESVLPFAAELISVSPDDRAWEASAEMVLRPLALSLLVPEAYYRRVRAYVEGHRMTDGRGEGQRLTYIRIGKPNEPVGDRIEPQSLLHKLQFKPRHDLTPWIRGEILKRFNYRCCDKIEEFNEATHLAMTVNRHVKFGSERHQKDDRPQMVDSRHFVLGWDNSEKKRRIAEHIRELESERNKLQSSIVISEKQLEKHQQICRAAAAAREVADFDAIDVQRHQKEISALRDEKRELEESNDAVKKLRERKAAIEDEAKVLGKERDELLENMGQLKDEIRRMTTLLRTTEEEIRQARKSGQFDLHEPVFDAVAESVGEPSLSIEKVFIRRSNWEKEMHNRITQLRKPLQGLEEKLAKQMGVFLREFREESSNLDPSVKSLDSFLGLLEQLRREDLPRYEKQFKDRLNDEVSKEVALLNTELREERKQIEEKIAQLNEALANVEYDRGTLMRLEPRPVQDREIEDFRRSLRECLDASLEPTEEAHEARFGRIKSLVERLADKERTAWRNKVIDVRNWYNFMALEVERDTQMVRSCYDGSSGQSGGEKAKLAFTILVAAIAYQFDIDPTGHTPGRFQFVVVDEMFSKVDDQNARYALKLFKQFGLQLLIVAPLDPKARVTEPFVDRYLHTVKDPVTCHSQLYSMTAQDYNEVVQAYSINGKQKSRRPVARK